MKRLARILAMGAILCASTLSAEPFATIEGRIDQVGPDYIMMGPQRYEIASWETEKGQADVETFGFETECWVASSREPYPIDFNTLVQIGYVDLANVTLQGRMVRAIEVLDLQQ